MCSRIGRVCSRRQTYFFAKKLSGETGGAQHLRIFRKIEALEMHLGVIGVFCMVNEYFIIHYEIQCNFLYI